MTRNAWLITCAVGSALMTLGAGADAFPDGAWKHAIQMAGVLGATICALRANWPKREDSDSVKVPRP